MTALFSLVSIILGVAAGWLTVWIFHELGVTSEPLIWAIAGGVTALNAHYVTITLSKKYIEYHKAKLEKDPENEKT